MSSDKQIGVYRTIKPLGGGSMGVVYLVEDTEGGGEYALKLMPASLSPSEREVRRFRREFMTLTRLKHPHIVEVYESGMYRDSLYFVMEYVEGPTLREHFLPGFPPDDESEHQAWLETFDSDQRILDVLHIAIQICDALSWTHTYGIIHRDLKPENMMLKSENQIKLLDFGIAKRYGGQEETSQSRSIMGTLTYISPEQAQCVDVDGRSDLYSLGVILYELLTGRPPFMSPEPIGRIYMHLNHQPAPLRDWNPRVLPALEDIVLRLLAKEPIERYQRAEDLREALEEVLSSSGIVQSPTEPWSAPPLEVSDPAFVGREEERDALLLSLEHLRNDAQGGFLLLSGSSGIGKTRLAREVMSSARIQQVEIIYARCIKDTPPYSVYQEITEQLRTSLAIRDEGLPQQLWDSLEETWFSMMYGSPPTDTIDSMTPSVPDPEGEKYLLFDTLRQMFERVLAHEPMFLVFDDFMFVDETSLELTEYLVRQLITGEKQYPLLIMGIFRNEDVNAEHPLNQCLMRLSSPDHLYQLYDLKPLTSPEVVQMASSMIGLPPAPEAQQQLMLQSQGIPYFVEELVKAWHEDQQMMEAGDCWYLLSNAFAESGEKVHLGDLPPALQKRLQHRLKRLSKEALGLAKWVAICGQEASFDLLQALTSWSEPQLLSCLEQLLQHKILSEDWTGGVERYRFYHPGIAQTLASELSEKQTRQYHLRAAQALKQTTHAESSFELLAHHFLAAGDKSQGAWYLLLAGEQQLRAMAYLSASGLLQRCEAMLEESPDDPLLVPSSSWWLRYQLANLEWLEHAGRYREGLQAVKDALDLYPPHLDCAPLWRWEASFYRHTGNYKLALECIQKALAHAASENEWRPLILQEAGRIYRLQGKHSAAIETFQEALSWAEAKESIGQQGRLHGLIGEVLHQRGEYVEAKVCFQRSLETATEQNDRFGEIEALYRIASLELDRGQTEDCIQHLEHSLELARELGVKRPECSALGLLGMVQLARRQYDKAQATLRNALTMASELGTQRLESELLGSLGILFYCNQRYPSARIYLEEGLQKATQVGVHSVELRLRSYLCAVDIQQHTSEPTEVMVELESILRESEKSDSVDAILLSRILTAHVLRLQQQHDQAEDQLIAARYLANETGHNRLLAAVEQEHYLLDKR